jgi:hypothetical protein
MANRWLQTKLYHCPSCGARYLHDHAHRHHCFECPTRTKPAAPLPVKVYCPEAGRS